MTNSANNAGDFVRDLGDAARQNPISAALIGMGVLWLFAGGARRAGFDGRSTVTDAAMAGRSMMRSGLQSVRDGASDLAGDLGHKAQRAGASSGDALQSAANAIREGSAAAYQRTSRLGSDFAESASDLATSIPRSASDIFDNTRSNLSVLFHEQPLLLGAVGLAIGAGIAASLPPTELEAEYFGETSDALKDKAQEFASEQAERAKAVAEASVKAAAEEARHQGLDPKGLMSAAADVGANVKTLIETATDSVNKRISPG
jgi:flagellar biosynthesis/type III secretory pathway protein FliH